MEASNTMKEQGKSTEHERRDWTIVLIIILLGFLFVILAGEWAGRFAPFWKLDANMQSYLDPDSDFLTNRPVGFFEPLDPSILTQPVWIDVFLTPGAVFETRTPAPSATSTPIPTNTLLPTATESPSPTAVPSTSTLAVFFPFPTNTVRYTTPEPTNTRSPLSADLQITKTDDATAYTAGSTVNYTIVVSNPGGPNTINGAVVADTFSTNTNIASASWTCSALGGATCTAGGSGNINDTVDLPAGSSLTYLVTANVSASPSGSLVNTATVTMPSGTVDTVPGNNTATDTNELITPDPLPVEMGTKDNVYHILPAGSTLTLSINLTADNDPDWDLVYYEYSVVAIPPDYFDGILLDWIIIQISDGKNWYTVFNWGDNVSDDNTNVAHSLLTIPVTPPDPEEVDQRSIASSDLYNSTGIAINIDGIVPPGQYTFIRFYAPPGDVDGQTEIDAIEVLP